MSRVIRIALVMVAAFASFVPLFARAQAYPSRPITIVASFAPGGGGDLIARLLAQKLSALMPQQVLVENRPGAGGISATQYVAKAAPDGYTLLLLSNVNAISQSMFRSLPYDIFRDFVPVSVIATTDVAIVVPSGSKLKSVADFIREAKTRPRGLTIGIGLIGTTQHLSAELFKARAGIDYTIVPFKSFANVLTALKAGDVDAAFELVPPVLGHIRDGGLRALAIGSSRRFAGLPAVPTVAENGVKNYEVLSWAEVAVPSGTPGEIVRRLNAEIRRGLGTEDLQTRYQDVGLTAAGSTPTEARIFLQSEVAKWRDAIERAGIVKQ